MGVGRETFTMNKNNTNDLFVSGINEAEIYRSKSVLQNYENNIINAETSAKYQAINKRITIDFSKQRIKRGWYQKCLFKNSDFTLVGAVGSRFIGSSFSECIFDGANFQFCDFTDAVFGKQKMLQASNFSQSNFCSAIFDGTDIENSSFSQIQFYKTQFTNCNMSYSTFENTIFDCANFENVFMPDVNLEFAEFKNIKMNNVVLPFHQIPFIFGGIDYLSSTKDNVWIYSDKHKEKKMRVQDYLELLDVFETSFLGTKTTSPDFFPLANIYLATGRFNEAYDAISAGLIESLLGRDFRMVKFLCKLAVSKNVFSNSQLLKLYEIIVLQYTSEQFNQSDRLNYDMHINEIKSILINFSKDYTSSHILLTTDITSDDYSKIGAIQEFIEECMKASGISPEQCYVEIRHNSPPLSFWIYLNAHANQIAMFAGLVSYALTNNDALLNQAISVAASLSSIGSFVVGLNSLSKHNPQSANIDKKLLTQNKQIAENMQQKLKKSNINVNFKLGLLTGLEFKMDVERCYK